MSEETRLIPPAHHEHKDIGFPVMLLAAGLMVLAVLAVCGVAALIFPQSLRDKQLSPAQWNFAAPVLQPAPQVDMAAFYAREIAYLNGTGWVDRTAGIAHVPIADAMRDVAAKGIPDWPPPNQPIGPEPVVTPAAPATGRPSIPSPVQPVAPTAPGMQRAPEVSR